MKVLILGDGVEEQSWASWFESQPVRRLEEAWPDGKEDEPLDVQVTSDLDLALATAGIDLVIVGGPPGFRAEALRRAAAEGLPIICLHPPGEDSEAYYQVSLSRAETGAVVVPDLPLRLHPGVARLRQAIDAGELGAFRGVRHECPVRVAGGVPRPGGIPSGRRRDPPAAGRDRDLDGQRRSPGRRPRVRAGGPAPGRRGAKGRGPRALLAGRWRGRPGSPSTARMGR